MKRILSICILIIALSGIIWVTVFTLNNKGIRQSIEKVEKKNIEKVTSNETKNNLSEIYNIYLNKEKHKIKIEYQLIKDSYGDLSLDLFVYYDGKKAFEKIIMNNVEFDNVSEIFDKEDIDTFIRINEKRFKILEEGEKDYLLFLVGAITDVTTTNYFIIDDNGDLLNEDGILVYDSSKNYSFLDDNFDLYYNADQKSLAIIDGNNIFALEEKQEKKKLYLEEYKYYLKDGKLKKELLQTFDNIKKIEEEK